MTADHDLPDLSVIREKEQKSFLRPISESAKDGLWTVLTPAAPTDEAVGAIMITWPVTLLETFLDLPAGTIPRNADEKKEVYSNFEFGDSGAGDGFSDSIYERSLGDFIHYNRFYETFDTGEWPADSRYASADKKTLSHYCLITFRSEKIAPGWTLKVQIDLERRTVRHTARGSEEACRRLKTIEIWGSDPYEEIIAPKSEKKAVVPVSSPELKPLSDRPVTVLAIDMHSAESKYSYVIDLQLKHIQLQTGDDNRVENSLALSAADCNEARAIIASLQAGYFKEGITVSTPYRIVRAIQFEGTTSFPVVAEGIACEGLGIPRALSRPLVAFAEERLGRLTKE